MTRRHAAWSGNTCLQRSAKRSLAWLRSNLFTPIKGSPLLQRSTRAVYWRRLRSGVLNAGGDGRCESLGLCLVGGTSVLGTGWRTGRIVVGPNECWKLTVARQVPRRELMESTGADRLPRSRTALTLPGAVNQNGAYAARRREAERRLRCPAPAPTSGDALSRDLLSRMPKQAPPRAQSSSRLLRSGESARSRQQPLRAQRRWTHRSGPTLDSLDAPHGGFCQQTQDGREAPRCA